MRHFLLIILIFLFFPVFIYARDQDIMYVHFGTLEKGSVHGIAIGPFYNIINDGSLNGLGISIFGQEAREINGLSIGWRNKAHKGEMNGVMLGLFQNDAWQSDVSGVSISLLGLKAKKTRGISMSGFLNQADRGISGFMLALANDTYKENLSGVALGGFYNSSGESDLNGLFISTLNNSGHSLKGVSITAGFNSLKGQVEGLQVGFGNQAKPLKKGMQIGIGNYAENSSGIQIGLINLSEGDGFIQIGLLNYARNNWIPFLPFINVNWSAMVDRGDSEGGIPASDLEQENPNSEDN